MKDLHPRYLGPKPSVLATRRMSVKNSIHGKTLRFGRAERPWTRDLRVWSPVVDFTVKMAEAVGNRVHPGFIITVPFSKRMHPAYICLASKVAETVGTAPTLLFKAN